MADERNYTIPLRREFIRAPRYMRAKRAVTAVKNFLSRHMKVKKDMVKVGGFLNNKIWEKGIKNPPPKVQIRAVKDKDGFVRAELIGIPEPKPKEKKGAKETKEKKEASQSEPASKIVAVEKTEKKAEA